MKRIRWTATVIATLGILATQPTLAAPMKLLAGLRGGAAALLPGASAGWTAGIRGGVRLGWGLELATTLERAAFINNVRYLGVGGEALYSLPLGHEDRLLGLGLTGGLGQYGNLRVSGRTTWSAGALVRMSVLRVSPRARMGWDVIGQLRRPGDRALGAVSPGIWIQLEL
jgi:hypothetical protein